MTVKSISVFLLWMVLTAPCYTSLAQVRLPRVISDGMVIQRDNKIVFWGWAKPGEKVTVTFGGRQRKTAASSAGRWTVELPAMKAGGPHTLKVSGVNELLVKDILIGDVWLCSGQSNMVHQMDIHDVTYAKDIANANYPAIRHFKVPTQTNLAGRREDVSGGVWQKAVGDDVRPFSAVAYFFARKLYDTDRVPIGLINASVGGSPIESWINPEGYKELPDFVRIIAENSDTAFVKRHSGNGFSGAGGKDKIYDKGLIGEKPWYAADFEPANWRRISIPGYWEDQGIKDLDGVVWYRKEIELPSSMALKEARVYLGRIVDADKLYINGQEIGTTTYQYPQRRYKVPSNVLKAGKNVFVIRVVNTFGKGGFVPDKPYTIFAGRDTVDLTGYWEYKVGEVFTPRYSGSNGNVRPGERRINPQSEPAALYNAMVGPLTQYPIKGVLWYQGESNAGRASQYLRLMQALISGWREVYARPDLPFIYAQLPNFGDVTYSPSEGGWAFLREAQRQALQIPNTAMAVTIDLGEWNDIHPDNKKDVGERMALAAQRIVYGKNVVHSGPLYKDHKIDGNRIVISFVNEGSGLIARDGEALSEFAIAGEDKKFVWAQARIEGNRVVVWSDEIANPRFVRYAWADNPDHPNLYNKEGLPASPFETGSN